MKKQKEIAEMVNFYKHRLAAAMDEKNIYDDSIHPDIDIIIFSLVERIETLLWVLEIELPNHDLLEQIYPLEH